MDSLAELANTVVSSWWRERNWLKWSEILANQMKVKRSTRSIFSSSYTSALSQTFLITFRSRRRSLHVLNPHVLWNISYDFAVSLTLRDTAWCFNVASLSLHKSDLIIPILLWHIWVEFMINSPAILLMLQTATRHC